MQGEERVKLSPKFVAALTRISWRKNRFSGKKKESEKPLKYSSGNGMVSAVQFGSIEEFWDRKASLILVSNGMLRLTEASV